MNTTLVWCFKSIDRTHKLSLSTVKVGSISGFFKNRLLHNAFRILTAAFEMVLATVFINIDHLYLSADLLIAVSGFYPLVLPGPFVIHWTKGKHKEKKGREAPMG